MRTDQCKQLALAVWLGAGLSGVAWATQPITINNPGFENPVLGAGNYTETIPGWSQGRYYVANPGVWIPGPSGAGVYNVSTNEYTSGQAAEGENMGYATTQAGSETGINQVLTATLQADATYVLKVMIGNPALYNEGKTADFRVELLAGGVLLNSATGPSPVDDSEFIEATVSYGPDAAPAQLGQPLEIRLLALDYANGWEVDFDDVQLAVALANPVASTGGPYVVGSGGSLALNGSASQASDGATIDAANYEWDLDNDGDYDEGITGATPTAIPVATLTGSYGMILGSNTIRLRVTDSAAKTATATTTVTLFEDPLDRFRSGGGPWDTVTANWGDVTGGPYDTQVWSNSSASNAILEGTAGTLSLASAINLVGLKIAAGTPWVITDNTLHFAAGSILADNGVNAAISTTIRSGITGSPTATANAGEILILDTQDGLPQSLGAIAMNCRVSGQADNRLTLQGSATDSSAGAITVTTSDNGQRTALEKRGSGTWTVGALQGRFNQRLRLFLYDNGRLIVNGDIYGIELRFESASATLELKKSGDLLTVPSPAPGAGRAPNGVPLLRGTIDNSSGGPITFASNPAITLAGDFTLLGGSLNFGTGSVALGTVVRTVTVHDPVSTMTLGGTISGAGGGLTKDGPGTLLLSRTNTNSYTGPTTVTAGTLALGNNEVLPNGTAVSIGDATLDAGTFTDTAATLAVTAAATIKLGTGAALAFADSSSIDWTGGSLNITGTFVSGASLRFGDDLTQPGLTPAQLALITVNGGGSGTFSLSPEGFLVQSGGGNTFATWIGGFNVGGQTGLDDDFDKDGLGNGLENILGTSPEQFNQGLTAISTKGGNLVFRHTLSSTPASDLTGSYEWSANLVDWNASAATVGGTTVTFGAPVVITPGTPDLVEVTATVTGMPADKIFARLKVTQH